MAVGRLNSALSSPALAKEAIEVDQSGTPRVEAMDLECYRDFVGSIEVEAVRTEDKEGITIERITFTPEASSSSSPQHDSAPMVIERPPMGAIPEDKSVVETIMGYFADSYCGDLSDCGPNGPRKSILKKHKTQPPVNRNVSFSNLEIREYKMTLGDHPSARYGPPMSLDWEYKPDPEIVDLDAYEKARSPRRHRSRLRLSIKDRERLLVKEGGFSYTEVKDAWSAALEVRKQRFETLRRSPTAEMIDEAWESANRKFWRLFGCDTL